MEDQLRAQGDERENQGSRSKRHLGFPARIEEVEAVKDKVRLGEAAKEDLLALPGVP
jgi:hypothetical protein